MSATSAPANPLPRTRRWPGRLLAAAVVVTAGWLLGQQYVTPNKRVVPVMAGLLISGLAWRVGMVAGLGVLVLTLPYPRGTTFGNTNLALILVLLIIWLLRITQRQSPLPRRTPVDIPIVGLLIMYMLSFYNVHEQFHLEHGLQNAELFLGAVLMFYLIVNNLRRTEDLQRLHGFMIISALTIFGLGVYELNHPAAVFVPGWIDFTYTVGTEFNTRNVRIGSAFHDFELLSEYCATTILLVVFLFVRARSLNRRVFYGGMLVLNAFVLFATVTRGAFIALAIGVLYLLWMTRRHLRFVPLTIAAVTVVVGFLSMNYFVGHYTRSGDLMERMFQTHVVHGWIPDDRADTWPNAFGRAMVHPLLGGGPSYADIPGYKFWWPHNVYLFYANLIGFPGALLFIWLLFRMARITRPPVDSLTHPDYARSFLIVCRAQLVVFAINEVKIDYLRNPIYLFPVWVMFAMWTATSMIARATPTLAALPATAPVAPGLQRRAAGQ